MQSSGNSAGIDEAYDELAEDVADGVWEVDSWEDTPDVGEARAASIPPTRRSSLFPLHLIEPLGENAAAAGSKGLNIVKTFGRRLFQRETTQAPAISSISRVLFGADKGAPGAGMPKSSVLVPLLGATSKPPTAAAVDDDAEERPSSSGRDEWRVEVDPVPFVRRGSNSSLDSSSSTHQQQHRALLDGRLAADDEADAPALHAEAYFASKAPLSPLLRLSTARSPLREAVTAGSSSHGGAAAGAAAEDRDPRGCSSSEGPYDGSASFKGWGQQVAGGPAVQSQQPPQQQQQQQLHRGGGDSGGGWRGCWQHKVMEVVPVLAVVFAAVLGTMLYLIIVDGLWPDRRAEFSLACNVGDGKWVRSSDRPLYSAMCPYMRDDWDCHKYGLEPAADSWRWEPSQCTVPRFDARAFLHAMGNRSIAFVGDQTAANAFDSFVCMLAEAELPMALAGAVEVPSGGQPAQAASSSRGLAADESGDGEKEAGASKWPTLRGWVYSWGARAPGKQAPRGLPHVVLENFTGGDKLMYRFPLHNLSLALYQSPFLVEAVVDRGINGTACQLSKSALTESQALLAGSGGPSTSGAAMDAAPRQEEKEQEADVGSSSGGGISGNGNSSSSSLLVELLQACYPNQLNIDVPDPLWAAEANEHDVLVLNSGRRWREEQMEMQGLGVFRMGARVPSLSLEGLVGDWAYPAAMAAVARWVGNSSNFAGTAVFRSYNPGHQRRECAARMLLSDSEALSEAREENFTRYDDAIGDAIRSTSVKFLNVSLLSAERGDGHPWMSSLQRPKPDCVNWCLPGVPDTWNELMSAMLLAMSDDKMRSRRH